MMNFMKNRVARKRHREQNPTLDDHGLNALLSIPAPWQPDLVMQHAKTLGYDETWTAKPAKSTTGKNKRNAMEMDPDPRQTNLARFLPRTIDSSVPGNTASGSQDGTAADTQLGATQAAAAAETTQAASATWPELLCAMCQDAFGETEVEAMACGHVFHSACIRKWMQAEGKERSDCCAFKCDIEQIKQRELDLTLTIGATTHGPLPGSSLTCTICHSVFGTGAVEALECGHTFHTACINDYIRTKGLTRSKCCPYKCRPRVVEVDSDTGEVASGSNMVPIYSSSSL